MTCISLPKLCILNTVVSYVIIMKKSPDFTEKWLKNSKWPLLFEYTTLTMVKFTHAQSMLNTWTSTESKYNKTFFVQLIFIIRERDHYYGPFSRHFLPIFPPKMGFHGNRDQNHENWGSSGPCGWIMHTYIHQKCNQCKILTFVNFNTRNPPVYINTPEGGGYWPSEMTLRYRGASRKWPQTVSRIPNVGPNMWAK